MERRSTKRTVAVTTVLALAVLGCATGGGGDVDGGRPDAGPADGAIGDGGRRDAGDASTDASAPIDASADAGPPEDATVDGGVDSGWDAGMSVCSPTSERIAIVEVMISSRSGSTDRGEWIEILNAGTCAVDLAGLELVGTPAGSSSEVTFTIAGTILAPGARWVLAQSALDVENHDLPHDEAYAGADITLDNGGDFIELRSGATVIDRVAWGATDFTHGYARSFPDGAPIAGNDSQLNWCNATAVYSTATGGPYRGTPRMPNGGCP